MTWWHPLLQTAPGRTRQASSAEADLRGPDWLGLRPQAARKKRVLLEPGETRALAHIDGPGMITRIWMTTFASRPHPALTDVVLRFFWDGEPDPSVVTSFGDFFGASFGRFRSYDSAPLSFTSGGFNCSFPMPFATGARLEMTNEGNRIVDPVYYAVTYYQLDDAPPTDLRFHAQWRRENPTMDDVPYTILNATGRGHYVGARLDMQNMATWLTRPPVEASFPYGLGFGMLEGQERIWVDNDPEPSIFGTGTEDFFNGGWYFAPGRFSSPTHGCTVRNWWAGRVSAYRFDINAPIPFDERIRVTIDHGIDNVIRADYSSVAYWYQAEPHDPIPPLRSPSERALTSPLSNIVQSTLAVAPIAALGLLPLRRRLRRGT